MIILIVIAAVFVGSVIFTTIGRTVKNDKEWEERARRLL